MQRAELEPGPATPSGPAPGPAAEPLGVVENMLQQDFRPPTPNHCWAGDITFIRTTAGWRYLAV